MAVTGRLPLLALLAVPVVALAGLPGLVGFLAVAGVLVALDVLVAANPRRLRLHRDGDSACRLGEVAQVRLLIDNPTRRRVRGRLRDAWPPSAGLATQRHRLDIAAGDRGAVTSVLRPTRRGDRQAVRVTVRALGPLRLAGRQGSHVVPWSVRVLPPFHSRRHLPSRLNRLRSLEGRTPVLVRGQGTEFDSLRGYVEGDDVRSIDWRATARRAEVVVRTWRPERDRHLLVVLDTSRTAAARVGDAPRLDAAMDAALLLAALASRAGDRVDLLAFDRRVRARVEAVSAGELLPRLVQAMAPLEPELVEADMAALVATILARTPHRALVVLLTGLDPAPLERGLLPVLGQLTHRHQLLVAAVADPQVAALAAGRGDAAHVYTAAAAERTRAERARLVDTLRRRGVLVVDELPDQLPPALADAYLDLKAAGRL